MAISPVKQWLARVKNDSASIYLKNLEVPDDDLPFDTRRAPLAKGARTPLNITVSEETRVALEIIGGGNRSAAIEELLRFYVAHHLKNR